MPGFLTITVDKFTFRVATDRLYTAQGLWALAEEGARVRLGLSDFLQQRSGDVAFAEARPAGTRVDAGEEIASVETIKVTLSLASPVAGVVLEVNPALEAAPEILNRDPYGQGWLAVIEAAGWKGPDARLMDPDAYFALMKREAEEEAAGP